MIGTSAVDWQGVQDSCFKCAVVFVVRMQLFEAKGGQHSTAQHSTAQHSAAQRSAAHLELLQLAQQRLAINLSNRPAWVASFPPPLEGLVSQLPHPGCLLCACL